MISMDEHTWVAIVVLVIFVRPDVLLLLIVVMVVVVILIDKLISGVFIIIGFA